MTKAAVMHYRVFELPWTPSYDEERRLRRVLGAFGEGDPLSAANRLMGSRSIDVWHERAA